MGSFGSTYGYCCAATGVGGGVFYSSTCLWKRVCACGCVWSVECGACIVEQTKPFCFTSTLLDSRFIPHCWTLSPFFALGLVIPAALLEARNFRIRTRMLAVCDMSPRSRKMFIAAPSVAALRASVPNSKTNEYTSRLLVLQQWGRCDE